MSNIVLVNSSSEIKLTEEWVPATKFKSKDTFVDENRNKIGSDYKGIKYQLIEKKERPYSKGELFGRRTLGTLAVICSLCFALFSERVRKLFTKTKATIRFAVLEKKENLPTSQVCTSLPKMGCEKEVLKAESQKSSTLPKVENGTVKLESIVQMAPWEYGEEPKTLPENWKKHQAEQTIIVDYAGSIVTIPKGSNYFTYQGKVAIGWHGTYNPPADM